MRQPRFANGRSVRSALERARLRHASRIVADRSRSLGRTDLVRIQAEDILKSRVFAGADGPGWAGVTGAADGNRGGPLILDRS